MDKNIDSYSISYQNDTLHSYMVFKLNTEDELIDYQIKIIKDNPVQNLLALHRKQFDNEVFLYYDITSKITMEQFLMRRKLSRYEFLTIIRSLVKGLQIGKRYLLHGGRYILDFTHIYINPSSLEVALSYMPINIAADVREELRTLLIDLIVYKAVFVNPEEGSFVYKLLSLLKSDFFSLEQLDKLAFNIAVESEEAKADALNMSKGKENAAEEANEPQYGKQFEGKENKVRARVLPKGRLSMMMFIQLMFIALALLIIRLLLKQNQNIDIFSITGAVLLVLSIDFLVVRKLGIFNKREAINVKEEVVKNTKRESTVQEKRNSRKDKPKGHQFAADISRANLFTDMETTVLSDQAEPYSYLINCHDNQNERIILNKASFIIGRLKNQVDYVSRNNAVGKVHAEIINRDDEHYLKDLNSRNGTYINGERIVSNVEYVIKNNDRIAFANSEYKYMRTEKTS